MEEINLPDDFNVDKKTFKDCKKLSIVSGSANKEQSDFVIQNGVLIAYKGNDDDVIIPDGVTCISRGAFERKYLDSIVLPTSVVEIEQKAFDWGVEKVTILGNLEKIGGSAFGWDNGKLVYYKVPLEKFSKADWYSEIYSFVMNYGTIEIDEDLLEKDLQFIGKNIVKKFGYHCSGYDSLLKREDVFQLLIDKKYIPAKVVDELIECIQAEGNTTMVAALLEYKDSLGEIKTTKKKDEFDLGKSEPTVADWRKLYKFKYVDGGIEIIGCTIQDDDIEVPSKIGDKEVTSIGRHAFDAHTLSDEKYFDMKLDYERKLVLPNTIKTIKKGAFYCVNNRDIYIPDSVTEIPEGMLIATEMITLHIPNSVTKIDDEFVWDTPFKVKIVASKDSYAYEFAKSHTDICELAK